MSLSVGEYGEERLEEAKRFFAHPALLSRGDLAAGKARLFLVFDGERTVGAAWSGNGKNVTETGIAPAFRKSGAPALLLAFARRQLGLPALPEDEELWDVLDETGLPTGRYTGRSQYRKLAHGDFMLAVHIYILTPQGQFLIQKRAACKSVLPGVWDITTGAVMRGETGRDAAIRETEEELGLTVRPEQMWLAARIKRRRNFREIWFVRLPFSLSDCKLKPDEVEEVRLVSKEELATLIKTAKHREPFYKAIALRAIENAVKRK